MAVFQCFFFSNGYIEYWENIEREAQGSLRTLFQHLLSEGEWDAAEAWRHDRLVCQVVRFAPGRFDCSLDCPATLASGEGSSLRVAQVAWQH